MGSQPCTERAIVSERSTFTAQGVEKSGVKVKGSGFRVLGLGFRERLPGVLTLDACKFRGSPYA